jgi:hypothetical protein
MGFNIDHMFENFVRKSVEGIARDVRNAAKKSAQKKFKTEYEKRKNKK